MPTETLRAEPDSSTHRSHEKKRKRKRKHKERRKHSKKPKQSKSTSLSSGSRSVSEEPDQLISDTETNSDAVSEKGVDKDVEQQFKFDIKPLDEYLPDVKALYKEVFTLVNKKEFKRMLPENLKKFDPREVRRWCLDEMEGISSKRLKAILCSKPMTSSSSESEAANSDNEKATTDQAVVPNIGKGADAAKPTTLAVLDVPEQSVQDLSILAELSKSPNETEIDELLVGEDVVEPDSGQEKSQTISTDVESSAKAESRAEILELELRARALQSFLKYQEKRQTQINPKAADD